MFYLIILPFLILGLYSIINRRKLNNSIKRKGIKTTGTIIYNNEKQGSRYQLGGNINLPTIKFTTDEGQEIIGQPVIGFVTQHEVVVPTTVTVKYDPTAPQNFCLCWD